MQTVKTQLLNTHISHHQLHLAHSANLIKKRKRSRITITATAFKWKSIKSH